MTAQALYLRWRPMTFEEVVGQEHVTHTLRNALVSGRVVHAYLLAGPRGTGKTSVARLLAKAVNCLAEDPAAHPCNACEHCMAMNEGRFLDLIEIDAASHTGVDDVRDLRDKIAFAPNVGRYKVYIIDEVHRFSGAAFDALLKTLEEPPAHAIFVLATTEIHKVPPTILSRCQRFDFRRIPLHQIVERLAQMVEVEGVQAELAALELVARQATGSLRDAISLLDQLITWPDQAVTLEMAQAVLGTAADESVCALVDALLAGDAASGLDIINYALDAGVDPRQFARQVTAYLRLVLLAHTGGVDFVGQMVPQEALEQLLAQAEAFPRRPLLAAISAFNEAASDLRGGWQPQLPLELALVESIETLHGSTPTLPPQVEMPPEPLHQSAPARATPPTAPPHAETMGTVTIVEIHARWEELLNAARQHDATAQALLRSGQPVDIEGDIIVFQMPSAILRDKIESDQTRLAIEAALQQVFGHRLTFRCAVGGARRAEQQPNVSGLLEEDTVLSEVVDELGGEIADVQAEDPS